MSMEKVYLPSKLGYVSPVVVLKDFVDAAHKADDDFYSFFHEKKRIEHDEIKDDTRKSFTHFVEQHGSFSESADDVIKEVDSALERVIEHFPIINYEPAYPPLHSKLMSHRVIDDIRKASDSTRCKMQHNSRCRYYKYRDSLLERPLKPKREIAEKDLIMTVNIMKPTSHLWPDNCMSHDFRALCEAKFLVRGNTSLLTLKNMIACQSDQWCNLEDTEDVDMSSRFRYRYPSSFIFIYDTFYLDNVDEKSVDITQPIREFMTRKKQSFSEFKVEAITDVKIIDLKLRLGFPYVFLHQGHCEHLIIFTDLRLLSGNDSHDPEDYPMMIYNTFHTILCCVCKEVPADFVITESDRVPICPAFMCHECFKLFHYDRNRRIGDFKAYHYIDHTVVK